MIIGIDAAKAAIENRTGIENVVYEVILNLLKIDQKNEYLLFSNAPLPKEFCCHKNATIVTSKYRRPWNKLMLPLLLRKNPCDVYLQLTDAIPPFAAKKSVAVFHDFAYEYFPSAYSRRELGKQRQARNNIVEKAHRIVCVSEATQRDLFRNHPGLETKTSVIYLGYDHQKFRPIDHPKDILRLDTKYILYTGRIEERKNTLRLVRAFFRLKKELDIPHKLILAGGPGHNYTKVYREIHNHKDYVNDVILPGHISHDRLPDLIAGSDVFVFPTLYEGFGLPLLEAMACGAAIVTSNVSSMPEIAGDAAIFINPLDENDLAEAMAYFIFHPEVKESYRKRGLERSADFSWEKTAANFLKLLESL